MKTIYENDFYLIKYNEDTKIMRTNFKPTSIPKTTEQARNDVINTTKFIEKYKPAYFISNQKENKYPFKVDEQKWIAETFAAVLIKIKLKKIAFILPEELIAELSLQQTIEESGKLPFAVKYLSSEKEATQWFNE